MMKFDEILDKKIREHTAFIFNPLEKKVIRETVIDLLLQKRKSIEYKGEPCKWCDGAMEVLDELVKDLRQ